MRIVEAISGFSGSGPAIFDAGESSLIEIRSALGKFACAENPGMVGRDSNEGRHWRGQPPGRDQMCAQRCPGNDDSQHKQEQPDVPQADVNCLVVENARLATVLALHVFFGGKHWLKM